MASFRTKQQSTSSGSVNLTSNIGNLEKDFSLKQIFSLKWFIISALIGLLVLPDAHRGIFDGLPITDPIEGLLVILIGAISLVPGQFFKFQRTSLFSGVFIVLVIVALSLRLFNWSSGVSNGFQACYRNLVNPLPIGQCEFSTDQGLVHTPYTRIDTRLDFAGPGWRLGFLNTNQFNFYPWLPGKILRDRLPFEASWSGTILLPPKTKLLLFELVGDLSLNIGGQLKTYKSYKQQPVIITFPLLEFEKQEGPLPIKINYHFDDGARSGQPLPNNAPPILKVLLQDSSDQKQVYDASSLRLYHKTFDTYYLSYLVSLLLLMLLLIISGWSFICYTKSFSYSTILVSFLLIAYAFIPFFTLSRFNYNPDLHHTLFILFTAWAVFGTRALQHNLHAPWPFLFISLALLTFLTDLNGCFRCFSDSTIMGAGEDWLTYETWAFNILEEGSLRGGRDIFYNQPLYRYWLAGLHIIFGDSLIPLRIVEKLSTVFLGIAIVWTLTFSLSSSFLKQVVLLFGVLFGAIITELALQSFADRGLSETLYTILLLGAVLAYLRSKNLLAVAVLCSLAAITRYNMLPATLALFLILIWLKKPTSFYSIALAILASEIILSLPILHNWVYGGNAVFIPTSKKIALLKFSDYLQWPWIPAIQSHLKAQFQNIIGIGHHFNMGRADSRIRLFQFISFLSLLSITAITFISSIAKRSWSLLLLILPFILSWAPFAIFHSGIYYPRHLIPGSIMGFCCFMLFVKEINQKLNSKQIQRF